MGNVMFLVSALLHAFLLVGANKNALFKLLEEPPQEYRPLRYTLKHGLGRHDCAQVITDNSPMALDVMGQMYKIATTWTFITGVNLQLKDCNGYILIARQLKYIKTLLAMIPLYYQHRVICLIGGGWHKDLNSFLQEVDVNFKDAEALVAVMGSKPSFYKRIQPNSFFTRLIFPVGEWEQDKNGVADFKGREIIVGSFNCCVFSELGPSNGDNTATAVKGSEIHLLKEIFKRLNLTSKIIVPTGGDPAGRLIKGKWSGGVMKMVDENLVDIANCGLWITYPKMASGIQMSYPLGQLCLRLLVPKRKLLTTKWYNILNPFQGSLWMYIISVIVTGAVFLHIFKMFSRVTGQRRKGQNFLLSLLQIISIFLLSGVLKTKQGALRQFVTWLVVCSFILTTCFSSSLISNLTSPRYANKMDTIDQLYRNGYFWTTNTVPDLDVMFNQEDYWQNLWVKRLRVIPVVEEVERLMMTEKLVKYGQQYMKAFFLDERFSNEVLEGFEVASQCHKNFFFGFANRRGSPFVDPLSKYIHRFHNGGLIEKAMKDTLNDLVFTQPYVKEVLAGTKSKMGVPQVLGLSNLRGAFYIWSVGIAVSFAAFIAEKYFYEWSQYPPFEDAYAFILNFFNK